MQKFVRSSGQCALDHALEFLYNWAIVNFNWSLCELHFYGVNLKQSLERETGIEPATNSLEGCDSTTELLPRNKLLAAGYQLLA